MFLQVLRSATNATWWQRESLPNLAPPLWNSTSRSGVQRDQLVFSFVNALQYTTQHHELRGATRCQGPSETTSKRLPCATSVRYILEVGDDDGFVEGPLGVDPDAVSPVRPALTTSLNPVSNMKNFPSIANRTRQRVINETNCRKDSSLSPRPKSKVTDSPTSRIVPRLPAELFKSRNRQSTVHAHSTWTGSLWYV